MNLLRWDEGLYDRGGGNRAPVPAPAPRYTHLQPTNYCCCNLSICFSTFGETISILETFALNYGIQQRLNEKI